MDATEAIYLALLILSGVMIMWFAVYAVYKLYAGQK